ncbi:hypothetical protein [Rivularia sp. UHCC 0363]|uniref:hypothetical protein n=1 Tax=Rivularia sp. UHCC 0363 TaxID=3110244 RepID=UPI002B206CA4|nr:hypothetical protein [Rivularia sp. UHCC 0363]MEA5597368.1 hypothetical protein [Rivularia sp. UHCC 0363]
MYLQPLKFAFSLYRLTWQIMGGIATGIYRGVQQRRVASLPVSAPVSAPAPVITIDLSPTEVEMILVAESINDAVTAPDLAAPDLNEPVPSSSEPAPTGDRSQIVSALLDEAYSLGKSTYPELIAYVEKHTGTGCSRRVISNWKKARKLVAEAEAA